MSLQAGLAFEQAPPFSLPLRFFLTAPLFLLAAAGLIMLAGAAGGWLTFASPENMYRIG